MKKRLIILGLFFVLMMSFVSAGNKDNVLQISPITDQVVTGILTLRSQLNESNTMGAAGTGNITNVTWEYSSDDSTWTVAAYNNSNLGNNASTNTNGVNNWTQKFNSTTIADINLLTWRTRIYNGSSNTLVNTSASATSVRIDNTVPVVSLVTTDGTVISKSSRTVSATIQNSSSCTVIFNVNEYVGTTSGDTCSYEIPLRSIGEGAHGLEFRGYDGYNYTLSTSNVRVRVDMVKASTSLSVEAQKEVATVAVAEDQKQKSSNMNINLLVVVIAIVAFILLTGATGAKGKKR